MENKHIFFTIGILLGFSIPFVEHYMATEKETDNPFETFLLVGTEMWHYIFLYIVVLNSIILYVKRFREKINPENKLIFLISGVSSGFALISIVATTVTYFESI